MAFQEILEALQTERRVDEASHVSAVLATFGNFSSAYSQVLQYPSSDGRITARTKRELLEQLLNVVADDAAIVATAIMTFCRVHPCRGPKQSAAKRASLGHVELRSKLEYTLDSARGNSAKASGAWPAATPFGPHPLGAGCCGL